MSHSDIAAVGESLLSSKAAAKPSSDLTSIVTTSSARVWLPASITSSRAFGSIQTPTDACLVKACGSRSSRISSFRSRISFLPGLRPVVASICATRSLALRVTTEPGRARVSIISLKMSWPPTDSTSGPCAWPRGSHQPIDFSCVAPHSTKRAPSRAASICATLADQSGPTRYTIMFLNTCTLFND